MNTFLQSNSTAHRSHQRAFTLVEVLVSMVILAMIMLIITQVIGQAQRSWQSASSRVTQFREARIAFDTITRNLRQATLNSYRNFVYANNTQVPTDIKEAPVGYKRYAELGFRTDTAATLVSGGGSSAALPGHGVIFQAPLGKSITQGPIPGIPLYDQLKSLLCIRGYFVRYSSDSAFVPSGLNGRLEEKNRYRLYEYRPPSEVNSAYNEAAMGAGTGVWTTINTATSAAYIAPVAENIVLLILAPSFAQAGDAAAAAPQLSSQEKGSVYTYNSYLGAAGASGSAIEQHRLPRAVQVSLVAIDEESAKRLAEQNGGSPPDLLGKSGASFTNPEVFTQDMDSLKRTLTEMRMNYRVFSSTVFIPGADV
jgi:uncharacterized protein (TIGR02599 family)